MSGDDVLNFCSLVVAVTAVIAIRSFTEFRSKRVTIAVFLAVFLLFRFGVPRLTPFIGWLLGLSAE
ncbi:hypothetical protein CH294_26045 [Rhodococcus sp. 14-2483-1-1]|uniref:hypothetical protein n=1 Tax=Nocardiaceae TaxID=85025 RepID=UPI00050CCEBE|nr:MULTISPECIES: hypothetical protein [Rhodococcus]AMY56312.1 hypothetical protein A3L23_05014 [Rhodococcus fascians D188]OZC47841.1 hypothetical protein CH267_26390 [Rhodococcus sp. 06-621-2]OZC60689.1 hypothetical protein CH277_26920 [Rhodococcus sp. 06-469-3-2]OZC64160.1 hypothetical protein CH251_26070 [Rhodococcus sp. 06-462-5]OZD74470.1 hypothetical protein CH263_00865 [Rhodococcus sp. 06-1059B-a]